MQDTLPSIPTEPLSLSYSLHQYDENYPDVCFLGTAVEFTVSSKGGQFASQDYGISLSVPPDALIQKNAKRISVQPCVLGPFKYPEEYEALSAVYLITLQDGLEKDVELRVEHFARLGTEKQANQMTFLSASIPDRDSGKRVVEFRPVKRGKFTVHERHGALQLKQSCYICIGTTKSSDTSKKWFHAFDHSFVTVLHVASYSNTASTPVQRSTMVFSSAIQKKGRNVIMLYWGCLCMIECTWR